MAKRGNLAQQRAKRLRQYSRTSTKKKQRKAAKSGTAYKPKTSRGEEVERTVEIYFAERHGTYKRKDGSVIDSWRPLPREQLLRNRELLLRTIMEWKRRNRAVMVQFHYWGFFYTAEEAKRRAVRTRTRGLSATTNWRIPDYVHGSGEVAAFLATIIRNEVEFDKANFVTKAVLSWGRKP